MAAEKTLNMTPANTNAEVDAVFDDTVRALDKVEAAEVARSEQDMLDRAVGLMDDIERRTWPPLMTR